LTLKETLRVPGSCWLAARCASRVEPAHSLRVAAHTSPIYVGVRGEELFSPTVAAYLLTLIEGSEAWVQNLATRPDPQRFASILKVFSEARERLHRRLHAHGIKH
jgi:phospholipid N-methyltransferase